MNTYNIQPEEARSGTATYSPEDNKLRLYVGRVPRDEYEKLRAEGWTSTPKQDCDFVATWTPARVKTCLFYADIIEDEDQSPEDRAADRAERFGGYLDKRLSEATGHADHYESGPMAHGFQSEKKAERAAARHDRQGTYASDAWSKAEYWQRRTSGVIAHALHKSSPGVRMGRIKEIETELRGLEKAQAGYAEQYLRISAIAEEPNALAEIVAKQYYNGDISEGVRSVCDTIAGGGKHRNPCNPSAPQAYYFEHIKTEFVPTVADYAAYYLRTHHHPDSEGFQTTSISQWIAHSKLRLAYENQMLEAAGGRAGHIEMIAGGFLGGRQIQKVNKSSVTGRVTSVLVKDNKPSSVNHWGNPWPDGIAKILSHTVETERLDPSAYRAPTEEELAEFLGAKKEAKKNAPKKDACPLMNPTEEDAQRLIALWNAEGEKEREDAVKRNGYASEYIPSKVVHMSQARYSELSKGSYSRVETRGIRRAAFREPSNKYHTSAEGKRIAATYGPAIFKLRISSLGNYYAPPLIIILTDKPQKPLPSAVWAAREVETVTA